MQSLDFWIEYGSTYTYLTVARIGKLASEVGVRVRWEPFFVMPIMAELGMTQGPFLPYPSKTAYMWRDIERRAAKHAVPYSRPSTYPVNSLTTARVACIASMEGWCQPFTEKVFELHWTQDVLIGSEANLREALLDVGRHPDELLQQAQAQPVKDRLKEQTARAKSLGVFGAPSFTVGNELFWGDDRLEEALEWAHTH
jgi:2-hydroxychromene-2-carboxylate isomerase